MNRTHFEIYSEKILAILAGAGRQQHMTTRQISNRMYLGEAGVRWWMARFERAGLVERVGKRKGWRLPADTGSIQ